MTADYRWPSFLDRAATAVCLGETTKLSMSPHGATPPPLISTRNQASFSGPAATLALPVAQLFRMQLR